MKEYETFTTTNESGDIVNTTRVEKKPGSGIKVKATTEEQRDSYIHHQELIEEMKKTVNDAYFHLIFKYGTIIFKELEEKAPGNKCNLHIIRFIILASYITFNGNLLDKYGHRIKKSSLKKIWDVQNRNSINETYDLLLECGYIYETKEGYIMINEEMIIKGEITKYYNELKKQDKRYVFRRIYVDNVQNMFYNTEPKQRKLLANLFKALPYINFKYNIFCSNPTETEESKIEPLTWTDLAKLCGYEDKKNIAKFKKDLISLSIFDRSVIGQFETRSGKVIVINPKVYYGDNDAENVKDLQRLFNLADGK